MDKIKPISDIERNLHIKGYVSAFDLPTPDCPDVEYLEQLNKARLNIYSKAYYREGLHPVLKCVVLNDDHVIVDAYIETNGNIHTMNEIKMFEYAMKELRQDLYDIGYWVFEEDVNYGQC